MEELYSKAKELGFVPVFPKIWKHNSKENLRQSFYMVELQKWLREVHDIHIYIKLTSLNDFAPYIEKAFGKIIFDPFKNGNKGISYTYEEALEAGLQEALKLIK